MKKKYCSFFLLLLAAALLTAGIFSGDFTDAAQKAVRICMECIGIG